MGGRTRWNAEGGGTGFTLLELLVALAIISVTLAAAYRLQHQGFRSVEHTSLMTAAVLAAQEKLTEAMLAIPRTAGGVARGLSGESLFWEMEVRDSPFPGVREVHIRIRTEPRTAPILEAMNYVYPP